ncbi:MAG TPA: hypothetical protein VFQ35_02995 [Polyangiaceae bacterium]|nr:hypothetical protein [Polyangiaceae bacterium]
MAPAPAELPADVLEGVVVVVVVVVPEGPAVAVLVAVVVAALPAAVALAPVDLVVSALVGVEALAPTVAFASVAFAPELLPAAGAAGAAGFFASCASSNGVEEKHAAKAATVQALLKRIMTLSNGETGGPSCTVLLASRQKQLSRVSATSSERQHLPLKHVARQHESFGF